MPSQGRGDRAARQIVVAQRGMTNVTGNEYFLGRASGNQQLAVGKVAVGERRVDAHFVFVVGQSRKLIVGKAKSPGGTVVGRTIGDPLRVIRIREQVLLQLGKAQACVYRNAVADDMQIRSSEIDNALARTDLDVGVPYVPLLRYGPIEDLQTRWHLAYLKGHILPDD